MSMLWGEIKRIFKKVPILVILVVILPVFAVSAIVVGVKEPTTPPEFSVEQVTLLEKEFNSWKNIIECDGITNAPELQDEFEKLKIEWGKLYDRNNHATLFLFQTTFVGFISAYDGFATAVKNGLGGATTVLITESASVSLQKAMHEIERNIDFNPFHVNSVDELFAKMIPLGHAWDNYARHIPDILQDTQTVTFSTDEKNELIRILNRVQAYLNAAGTPTQLGAFLPVACEYLELNINLVKANSVNNITHFQGFTNFNHSATRDRIAILGTLVTEHKTHLDYSTPYTFGKVLHAQTGTSGMDFVFNNMEQISILLILLGVIIVVFCIFDDIKKNTIIGSLVGPGSRRKVITAKLLACAITIALAIGIFGLLFFTVATIVTGTATAPTILTAFGGSAIKISPFMLLFVYLLSLFFKILFFASITALFCINAKSLKSILIKSGIIIGVIILANALFTLVWQLLFYQYLPLIALDFAGFFGVGFMLSAHLASTFIWFTLPVMILLFAGIIAATIYKFNRRDF